MVVFCDEYEMKKKIYNLDLLGQRCPVPVLKISRKYKDIDKGDILVVNTDDPKAEKDILELSQNIKIKLLNIKYLDDLRVCFKLQKY